MSIVGREKNLLKGDSYFEVLFSSRTEFVKRNATCLCIRSSSPFSLLPSDWLVVQEKESAAVAEEVDGILRRRAQVFQRQEQQGMYGHCLCGFHHWICVPPSSRNQMHWTTWNCVIWLTLRKSTMPMLVEVQRHSHSSTLPPPLSVQSSEKQHRFDLVVIGRVFQFYSDSRGTTNTCFLVTL